MLKPKGKTKYSPSITAYKAITGCHFFLTKNPAAKALKGSATIPNIQKTSGLAALAKTLPIKAEKKPAYGPKTTPSTGIR